MLLRSWSGTLYRVFKQSANDRVTTAAASLAFHWFLAVFPGIIAILGAAGLVGLSHQDIEHLDHTLEVLLPSAASSVIVRALESPPPSSDSIFAVVGGSVVALWSMIEAMASLQVGLDVAYGIHGDRGFVRRRINSIPLVALTLALGGAGFALLVLGTPVEQLIRGSFPMGSFFVVLWTVLRWIVGLSLISILFSAYYTLGPQREHWHWDWISPGGVLATAGWVFASLIYSYYLNDLGHSSLTYGAFAGVAVLIIWLFLAGLAVLLGAELNRELLRQTITS